MTSKTYNSEAKMRVAYPDLTACLADFQLTGDCGGWYFVCEDGRVYWYSYRHLPTEILLDTKGNGKLCFRADIDPTYKRKDLTQEAA